MSSRSRRVYLPPLKTLAALSAKERSEVEAREKAELDAALGEWGGFIKLFGNRRDISAASVPLLRIKMECLMDVRYNPFAEAPKPDATDEDGNDGGTYNWMKRVAAWCFTPMKVALYDSATARTPVKTYSNEATASFESDNPFVLGSNDGWKEGENGLLWLAYYPDSGSITEDSALLKGWATNRPCIGRPDRSTIHLDEFGRRIGSSGIWATLLPDYDSDEGRAKYKWLQRLSGEFIEYPQEGGWLEISYGGGMRIHDYKGEGNNGKAMRQGRDEFKDMRYLRELGLEDKIQWLLYKAPEVEVVRNWGDFGTIEVEDVETRATLHPDAKEELAIETKCGTLPHDVEGEPLCRGLYLDALRNCAIGDRDMMRAGVTDRPEQLFINSLYSQYATRHTKLSGEAYIYDGALAPRTEANQGTARFIVVEERQDLIEDCGDVTVVELTPDIYKAVESEENI